MDDADRLFRTYHAPLVRYLTRRLGDRDWAEEIAQETFLRALRQSAASLTNERSWLFAVATNLIRDEARKDARRRRHLQLLADEMRDAAAPAPDSALERAHEQALARKSLDALAERDRNALLMREEGLDYTEIADALSISVGSVGTTLARARKRLVEAFEAQQRASEGEARDGTR
ncbi:MAG TPA: sigma-70 family RNA polymerase sigma factor [Gemmatimonadaceae bacterium]|nr:sigma-70 family RNA polymerase sigma factor [Gemmatimonadaceae bacterium]